MILINEKSKNNPEKIEEEIGDLLFSVVQLARHLKTNPEIALMRANKKFTKRMSLILQYYENKEDFIKSNNKIKEKYWNKVKKL